eukprot:9849427-Lingulodinium_polyedra.AAC.1
MEDSLKQVWKATIQSELALVTKKLETVSATVGERSILIAEHSKKIRQLEERRSLSPGGRASTSISSSSAWAS